MNSKSNERELYLSDGYFGLGEYIALSPKRQEDLLDLADMIRSYIRKKNTRRPLNILLEARPGAGKSYLVKELSKLVERTLGKTRVEFLAFNLTTLETPRELSLCFRKIQNCNFSGAFPVVLFDEVDTEFPQKRYSYSTLLAPMYDGKVYEGGEFFHIGGAVFFFAASKALLSKKSYKSPKETDKNASEGSNRNENSSYDPMSYPMWLQKRMDEINWVVEYLNQNSFNTPDKLLDFLDRLDRIIFLSPMGVMPEKNIGEFDPDKEKALLELYLIVASMIFKSFPGKVKYIERHIFGILSNALLGADSRRKPDSFVANSYPPKDWVFRVENLPPHCRDELREIFKNIEESTEFSNTLIKVGKNRHDDD